MPDAADRAAVDAWSSTTRMPFAVESLPSVRHQLLADITGHHVGDDAAYDAALVLAELVSNALKYARPLRDGALQLEWGYWDDTLHVQVTDGGAATEPGLRSADPTETSGRGLSIVDALSATWGVERAAATTTVWVTLRVPPPQAHRPTSTGHQAAPADRAARVAPVVDAATGRT